MATWTRSIPVEDHIPFGVMSLMVQSTPNVWGFSHHTMDMKSGATLFTCIEPFVWICFFRISRTNIHSLISRHNISREDVYHNCALLCRAA